VICLSKALDTDLEVWEHEKDRMELTLNVSKKKTKARPDWAPLFIAEDFLADDPVLELEHYSLKDRKLRMLGERVTRQRERILEVAKDQALKDNKNLGDGA
jgi:hypothetical protein